MTEPGAIEATSEERAALRAARQRLLALHKALLDRERSRHEHDHGPIQTTQQHLQLLMEHPSFAWLRHSPGSSSGSTSGWPRRRSYRRAKFGSSPWMPAR